MAGDADTQGRSNALPLGGLARLSPCQLQALKSYWITTVDSLVAAAATREGRAGLCSALDIESVALDAVLQDARNALGEKRYRELLTPRPGGPTGALLDDDQQQPTDGSAKGGDEEP